MLSRGPHKMLSQRTKQKELGMPIITTTDGTEIFYKDWVTGQPLFFHHGWPLSADDWDSQDDVLPGTRLSVIAHDVAGMGAQRRLFSDTTWIPMQPT
jgi:pimeloyl-ACP methyl ester carboxylesterase